MANNTLWVWGDARYGRLGQGNLTKYSSPVSVLGLYTQISTSLSFCLAIDTNGKIWGWGLNADYQLAQNDNVNYSTPVSIMGATGSFIRVSAGISSSYAIDSTGQVFGWGLNGNGVLGVGDVDNRSRPTAIARPGSFVEVSSGNDTASSANSHVLALDGSGMVYCWGAGSSGKLGNNATDNQSSPVAIARSGVYKKIAAGEGKASCGVPGHSLAIDITGQLYTWGGNNYGQLGIGSTDNKSSPVLVSGSRSYVEIQGGYSCSYAIDTVGMVWAWGRGDNGQLGINSTDSQSSPVAIARTGSYVKLGYSVGLLAAYAWDSDGMVWAWGSNSDGQLGDGTVTFTSSPVAIARVDHYYAISGGAAIEGPFPSPYVPKKEDTDSPRDMIGMHNERANTPGGNRNSVLGQLTSMYKRGNHI